jgi:hypothetical protein
VFLLAMLFLLLVIIFVNVDEVEVIRASFFKPVSLMIEETAQEC